MHVSLLRRSLGTTLALALAASSFAGCGASAEQPHVEVATRKQIPVPVCTMQLAPVRASTKGKALVRSLEPEQWMSVHRDRKSTRLNSSHLGISYAVFCLKKKIANRT